MNGEQDDTLDVAEIGRRLREARNAKSLSLDAVAKRCGISPSLLSQVERGKVSPSLATLHAISQALSIPMFELFGSPVEKARVSRAGSRNMIRPPGTTALTYELVSSGQLRNLQVVEMRLRGEIDDFDHSLAHPGEECVVVLEGEAQVQVGEETFALSAGDSVSFLARVPHRFGSPSGAEARLLVAMTPPAF